MREREVGDLERADFEAAVVVRNYMQFDLVDQSRFGQFASNKVGSERRGIDRHAQIGREVRHCADMILMRMGQHDRVELLAAFFDKFQIGEDQVDARVLVPRKGHAQIDHQPPALATVEVDVHADFARAAKREEQQFVFGSEILLHAARSASMASPSRVRSESTASNSSVCSSNRIASPPVATTLTGRPISFFIRAIRPSIRPT